MIPSSIKAIANHSFNGLGRTKRPRLTNLEISRRLIVDIPIPSEREFSIISFWKLVSWGESWFHQTQIWVSRMIIPSTYPTHQQGVLTLREFLLKAKGSVPAKAGLRWGLVSVSLFWTLRSLLRVNSIYLERDKHFFPIRSTFWTTQMTGEDDNLKTLINKGFDRVTAFFSLTKDLPN